jgi:hypothetical protein
MTFDITWKWNRNRTRRQYYGRLFDQSQWIRIPKIRYDAMLEDGAHYIEGDKS